MVRLSPLAIELAAAIALLPLSSAVDVEGFLGNACNGETLYTVAGAVSGMCYGFMDQTNAGSLSFSNFAAGEGIFLYSDNDCTTMIDQASTAECFLVSPRAAVYSFMSNGGSAKK